MVTVEESETAAEVIRVISDTRGYKGAVECFQNLFAREESWGAEVAKDKWNPADFDQIRAILSEWFA